VSNTIANIVRAVAAGATGYVCRRCNEGIARDDAFGQSERVCRACRSW
jgi:formylmethanofuran dehydrogenase subunit E